MLIKTNIEQKKALLTQTLKNGNYPQILYKYRTVKEAEKILNNFLFWFAKPDSFNDPFDCNLSEVKLPELHDAKAHFLRIGIDKEKIEHAIEMYRREPNKLSKLVCDVKESSILNKGVFSLSEAKDDILMWSHYADFHKGVVFGLRIQNDLKFFLMPIRIDYKDTYEELNYLRNPQKSTIDTLRIKSSQWKYEKEIRIYKDTFGLHPIKPNAIVEIYFGIRTKHDDIEIIKNLCFDNGLKHIKLFKAYKKHGAFGLMFKKIPKRLSG